MSRHHRLWLKDGHRCRALHQPMINVFNQMFRLLFVVYEYSPMVSYKMTIAIMISRVRSHYMVLALMSMTNPILNIWEACVGISSPCGSGTRVMRVVKNGKVRLFKPLTPSPSREWRLCRQRLQHLY